MSNTIVTLVEIKERAQQLYPKLWEGSAREAYEKCYLDMLQRGEIKLVRSPKGKFDGAAYNAAFDDDRLTGQARRIYELMVDGQWRTLAEIEAITKDPQSSISAQLRHLRKARFGSHLVERQSRGERKHGLFEYRIKQSNPANG